MSFQKVPSTLPPTIYEVRPDGDVVAIDTDEHVSGRLNRAMDVLAEHCGGYAKVPDKWINLLGACLREGRDPEGFARHLVKLSKAVSRPAG